MSEATALPTEPQPLPNTYYTHNVLISPSLPLLSAALASSEAAPEFFCRDLEGRVFQDQPRCPCEKIIAKHFLSAF